MSEDIYLTPEGAKRMREELEELTGPRRRELAKRLRAAIQQGDLSENADYIAAKEEQGFLEGRIQELQATLRNAVIIQENGDREQVELGARITIQEEGDPPETYLLVGVKEADPRNGRISDESPIGRALLGRKEGDQVSVETPGGAIRLTIMKIE
jgi:transcription elongation factor GreA